MISRIIVIAALLGSSSAMALDLGVVTSASAGMRRAGFQAAPTLKGQNLAEFSASVSAVPRSLGLPVTIGIGAFASFQTMGNDLGPALSEFGGYQIGPEIKVSKELGAWAPFGRMRLAFGHFSGSGIENWGNESQPAYFLYDTTTVTAKNFVTQGTHLALGTEYAVSHTLSVVGELDLGYDAIRSDARVTNNEQIFRNKEVTPYNSQALLFGGRFSI
jgi:hypothetical protein